MRRSRRVRAVRCQVVAFPLSIIILADTAPLDGGFCPGRSMLLRHNSARETETAGHSYLANAFPRLAQWVATSRKELRRFPWQVQMAVSLPNFSLRGEIQ
jgi:hypothetical protein